MYVTLQAKEYYEAWLKNSHQAGEEPSIILGEEAVDFFLNSNRIDFSVGVFDDRLTLASNDAIRNQGSIISLKTGVDLALGLILVGGLGCIGYDELYGNEVISRKLKSCFNDPDRSRRNYDGNQSVKGTLSSVRKKISAESTPPKQILARAF